MNENKNEKKNENERKIDLPRGKHFFCWQKNIMLFSYINNISSYSGKKICTWELAKCHIDDIDGTVLLS